MRITQFVMKLVTEINKVPMVVLDLPQGYECFEFSDQAAADRFEAVNAALVRYSVRAGERVTSCSDPRAIPF